MIMRFSLIFAVVFLCLGSLNAQVHVGVNFNIGRQPVWGPVGYDFVEYYYIPDIDVFYYVPTHRFVYLEGGHWIFRTNLPDRKSTRLNSSHLGISYAVFCLKKKIT